MSNIYKVTLSDGLTPFVKGLLESTPKMKSSILKSAGWFVQRELKKGSRGRFIGQNWKKRWKYERRLLIDPKAPRLWYGQLHNALGYAYSRQTDMVNVGWTSRSSAMEGRLQEEGYRRAVTPFVRRFFGKRGIYFKRTTKFLEIPARPFIEPKYDEIRNDIPAFISMRVEQHITNGGFTKRIGKTRKYEVYK